MRQLIQIKYPCMQYTMKILFLVNETCEVLHNLAEKNIDQEHFNRSTDLVAVTKQVLQHHYTNYCIRETDDICWHGLGYGPNNDTRVSKLVTDYLVYKFPFYTCAELPKQVH